MADCNYGPQPLWMIFLGSQHGWDLSGRAVGNLKPVELLSIVTMMNDELAKAFSQETFNLEVFSILQAM